jgi:hypothetical protein
MVLVLLKESKYLEYLNPMKNIYTWIGQINKSKANIKLTKEYFVSEKNVGPNIVILNIHTLLNQDKNSNFYTLQSVNILIFCIINLMVNYEYA